MKTKLLLLVPVMLMHTALNLFAQNTDDAKPSVKDNIPFGKKMPAPDLNNHPDKFMPPITQPLTNALNPATHYSDINAMRSNLPLYRQQLMEKRRTKISDFQSNNANTAQRPISSLKSGFHLTKDINALAESNPLNNRIAQIDINDTFWTDSAAYAVLNNVAYFIANDGVHGNELWRSDGTGTGTYMVLDLEPGSASPIIYDITAVNGKIYFSGYASAYGSGVWVSDGTESGTQLLINVNNPTNFFAIGKEIYFIADGDYSFLGAIWKTDGTTAGTTRVLNIGDQFFGGEQITQPTVVNDLLYFTFLNYETFSWELWRTDGTDAGTFNVGAFFPDFYNIPAQLTSYNNKLYFSASDGSGRKLWVSDGTDAGTIPAQGNNDVMINADFLATSFPKINNVLYMPGEELFKGNGLYKYDASKATGVVRVKDFAPIGDTAFIVPSEMQVVNDFLYFKVTNHNGGVHEELWKSKGTNASTQLISKFPPAERINHLSKAGGILYFVKFDNVTGNELWRTVETPFGTMPTLVSDIFKGPTSSYPAYYTAFGERLMFGAVDAEKGNELFITDGAVNSAKLVKDINTVVTTTSNAGFNFYNYLGYRGMAALGNDVLFNAYERVHGSELYKSDGTGSGTKLLNDVIPGEEGFNIQIILSKKNAVYFIAAGNSTSAIYKTNGNKNTLRKMTPDYSYIQSFVVTDKGLVFYVSFNYNTFEYELWRTDGTTAGTFLLSSTLYYSNYLNVIGNTALFVAGDGVNGYELWKSDGSVPGTAMVKDINPGIANSTPGGMFVYKDEAYFAAYDGIGSTPSFWKSNGKDAGTIKLKDIDPWWGSTVALTTRFFCALNNTLYFSAVNHSNTDGTVFWKTDGTPGGTKPVKDINPASSTSAIGPIFLTDVEGTLFFVANDGIHGRELWKSDGTENGTQLVSDITPGSFGSIITGLTSFGGKLYFQNAENSRYYLWSSDGTDAGTIHVADPGITNVGAAAIFATKDKLFVSGYTAQLGTELYASSATNPEFIAIGTENKIAPASKLNAEKLDIILYPNPTNSSSLLQIKGNAKDIAVSITDMAGKVIWEIKNYNNLRISLPVEKLSAGVYNVTVECSTGKKTLKLVKE